MKKRTIVFSLFIVSLLLLLGMPRVEALPSAPTGLKVENQISPQRLTTFTPEFSWLYVDNEGDNMQKVQIQVGTAPADNSLWNYTITAEFSDTVQDSDPSEEGTTSTTSVKMKEIQLSRGGKIRCKWEQRIATGLGWTQLRRNDNDLSGEIQITSTGWEERVRDFSGWSSGDLAQLYVRSGSGDTCYVRNFRVCYDLYETATYAGSALSRAVQYWWRVRVQNNDNIWSDWSDNENFKISSMSIENIWTEGENIIDRDKDVSLSNATDNITIWVQGHDNSLSLENATCLITIKDNQNNTLAENIDISNSYENIDENKAKWKYVFNPPDDSNLGYGIIEVYLKDENALGGFNKTAENLFRIDDKIITVSVDQLQYEELTISVIIKATLGGDNSIIENQQLTTRFYNPNDENRKQFTENTNENGEISINTILINEILGEWTITAEMSIGENDNLDGIGSTNFDLSGALCELVAITPSDSSITGTISSKLENAAELHLMVQIYDIGGTILVEKSETYNVGAGKQYRWEIPYGIALSEGTYSYSVRLWNYDYSNQYDSVYAEVHISIAVSSTSTTDWYVSSTLLIENIYNITLAREFIVTNSANITKQNYLFREAVPAPYGSLAIVNIGGIHELTKTIDNIGTISHTFDVSHNSQKKISITSTIWGALSYEEIGEPLIVTHYHMGQPILVEKHTCKVRSILNLDLYNAEIELPYDNVIQIIDSDGRGYNFWAGGSTWVKIPHFDADSTIEFEVLTAISEDLLNKLSRMLGRSTYGIPVLLLVSISAIVSAIVMHLWSRKTKVKTGTLQLLTLIGLPFFAAILLLVI